MAVITISRQYGSGGDEVAACICELLGYRYFDKRLMIQLATEAGLSPAEVIDFSEDNYKVQGFLKRLFEGRGARAGARVSTWTEGPGGIKIEQVAELDEAQSITFAQSTIQAAYILGNVVIVGRGGQALLAGKAGVLHVRIEAPLADRDLRVHEQEKLSLGYAQDVVVNHDRAAAAYLKRFYDIDWADPALYDLIINTGKLGIEGAVQVIVQAVNYLPSSN
ncbi:MAG: cytidylate kinase family protein [Anaerolineae bacterium]|nr:cytidylate kinase family protein [Anaerolineae bacterium]